MINYHIKGLYKTTCYKTKSNFSQFFFSHWLLHKCFFSFLIKAFANFEKLIRFHWQAFIVYKNGENLKMLIEIFCQKLIVSNVILAFLDHLKPKISSSANHGGWHRAPPFFKISGSAPNDDHFTGKISHFFMIKSIKSNQKLHWIKFATNSRLLEEDLLSLPLSFSLHSLFLL